MTRGSFRGDPNEAEQGTLIERALRAASDGPAVRAPREDKTRIKLLDAAYEQFCETGIARTSMEEVARRAGTARITIYRKFDSKDALVDAVMLREFQRYFGQFIDEMRTAETVADRVVAGFVTSLCTIGQNPLITRLLELEPAMVPGLVGGGDSRTMFQVRDFVAMQIAREQEAGNILPEVSTRLAADLIVRITGSFLTSRSDLIALDDEPALVALAEEFILPMLRLS
ncbi:TetR/AcrR family transcriptional regulator [Gordonia alkaliphila]|uniref:TetR/AcrR family transcriptional regulator n=1 Tax=Gordonia alkaliphila TaxID=1053547 RepID=UPI001FF59891|nr:TetR/AcrR family transcriptional regulator [Gordonia alkaliphila]MCK0439775.1 TetR/AcrR family transcriptional regulator [Gordonia alkaliphila]